MISAHVKISGDYCREYGINSKGGCAGRLPPIGPNDLMIAAHALALDAILVTVNEAEFSGVSGLRVENWVSA
jgi:predicted nucleic acid-binding protein